MGIIVNYQFFFSFSKTEIPVTPMKPFFSFYNNSKFFSKNYFFASSEHFVAIKIIQLPANTHFYIRLKKSKDYLLFMLRRRVFIRYYDFTLKIFTKLKIFTDA